MKKIILISFIILTGSISFGQLAYYKILTSPLNQGASNAIETDYGDIIMFISYHSTYLYTDYIQLLKINIDGDTIASKEIKKPYDCYFYTKILKIQNLEFIGVGFSFNIDSINGTSINNKIQYLKFDQNLELISSAEISYPDTADILINLCDAIINTNDHIIAMVEEGGNRKKVTFIESTLEGDSITSTKLNTIASTYPSGIMQKPDENGYYFTARGNVNVPSSFTYNNIVSVDNDYIYERQDSLPGYCSAFSKIKTFNKFILAGGQAWRPWPIYPPYSTTEYCIEKMDTAFNVIKQVFLSHVFLNHNGSTDDTISSPALFQNFDFVDTNFIFTAHYRESLTPMPNWYNFFTITKFNSNLEIKWQYYFGYDALYRLSSILATSDGGCFINGGRYDYQTQNAEFDEFYLKLDSAGIFDSFIELDTPLHSAIVYPNPGRDEINLQSGTQINSALFQIFNISGKPVFEKQINSSLIKIPVIHLPKGAYLWRILLKNRMVDSGKWIKE